ncbi:hypothetical protein GWI33_000007 [Rhynchophorus ferrugineus]|uniref:Uncharacterized protein n=1 Tax=Rhynchophorus ferrugineus TaxID=354439 RepID=A0A834IVV5_RHYFE|nr:hypothetical protein GWI33_000007 [Rhynchophorus ferrugineus]
MKLMSAIAQLCQPCILRVLVRCKVPALVFGNIEILKTKPIPRATITTTETVRFHCSAAGSRLQSAETGLARNKKSWNGIKGGGPFCGAARRYPPDTPPGPTCRQDPRYTDRGRRGFGWNLIKSGTDPTEMNPCKFDDVKRDWRRQSSDWLALSWFNFFLSPFDSVA